MTTLANENYIAQMAAQNHPYSRLYQAVILQAMQDLTEKEHHDEAREWLLSPESEYAFTTAGISAPRIRELMIRTGQKKAN